MARSRPASIDGANPVAETLAQVAIESRLDPERVRAQVDAVLADPLYWFPVRHHSPTVAAHLQAVIAARQPKVVFIEGPAEANELIPYLIDAKTRPPVAIYSSYRDDQNVLGLAGIASPSVDVPARFACWYPMLAYSPEYVAMQAATRAGADVVFIDLPHYGLIRPASAVLAAPVGEPPAAGKHSVEREDEKLLIESGFYQRLAQSAGYRSWNEGWDSLFEFRDWQGDFEAFRKEMAVFCAAARATSSPARIAADGTRERERHFLRTIRQTLAARKLEPEQAMVVCGGFHLFLDRDDATPPPELPSGTVYQTIVPYSFFRVSELSGYGAGNRAPQFYQSFWELSQAGRAEDLLIEHVVAVIKQARKDGEPLSSADAIASAQHARMLANLRGRPTAILDDIHDALITCCSKGDPQEEAVHLLRAMDAVDIGTKIGRVTDKLGRLPVVNDFYGLLDDLQLGELLGKEKKLTLDLDKRQELASRQSVFLHRLIFLDVPVGELGGQVQTELGSGTLFREHWMLRWNPKIEPALVELSLYGDTLESAVLARLEEDLARDEMHAEATCKRLVSAIDMDLPNVVERIEEACSKAIDHDNHFVSLSGALGHLAVLDRYAVYRNLRREVLADLIVRCYDRACFALPDVASVPEQQQMGVVQALLGLAEVVLKYKDLGVDRVLFGEHVRAAAGVSTVPFLRGVFLGMLAELREITPVELAAEVEAYARAPREQMVVAGDFLEGILTVSRTSIMLGADPLIAAIDELLRAADWDAFLTMIPRMRAAFERLHDRQTDSLAIRVAERYGLRESESLTELQTSADAALWIARIDHRVAEVMKDWSF